MNDFWDNASINNEGANGEGTVESTIKRTKVVVTEQTIREVLLFGDQLGSPTEIHVDQIREVLDRMGYEGTFLQQ